MLTMAIIYSEWRSCKQKKVRGITAAITLAAAVLALTLLFQENLPGPTQLVEHLFGWIEKYS